MKFNSIMFLMKQNYTGFRANIKGLNKKNHISQITYHIEAVRIDDKGYTNKIVFKYKDLKKIGN